MVGPKMLLCCPTAIRESADPDDLKGSQAVFYYERSGCWLIGESETPMAFCPWCGERIAVEAADGPTR